MEFDVNCPRCYGNMILDGEVAYCPGCSYQRGVHYKRPISYSELLKENDKLRARIAELEHRPDFTG